MKKAQEKKDISQAPKWIQEFIRKRDEIIENRKKRARGELPPLYKLPEFPPEDCVDLDKIIAETPGNSEEIISIIEENQFFDDMPDEEFFKMLEDISWKIKSHDSFRKSEDL